MNRIITIGREFGSGDRELGRRLSEIMEIAYYDQEVITEISRRTEMSEQYIRYIMNQRPIISYPAITILQVWSGEIGNIMIFALIRQIARLRIWHSGSAGCFIKEGSLYKCGSSHRCCDQPAAYCQRQA